MSSALVGILVSEHGHRLDAAFITIEMVRIMKDTKGVLTWWPGILLRNCRWLLLGPRLCFG